ncbi:sulfatase [Oscillatoria amoena NRMC-F 0135]|nr:sulfatase [Oscillatoria amoena NRMC-F 0135]
MAALATAKSWGQAKKRKNVLMIAVDDLRPELGCYGAKQIHSPNIDALAARGVTFESAYCQQAVCSPSRTSLLTGKRPDTTKIYELQTHFRKHLPDTITLPQAFKQAGYQTAGLGKIYHGGLEDNARWTIPHWTPGPVAWNSPEARAAAAAHEERMRSLNWVVPGRPTQAGSRGPAWDSPDVTDDALADGKTARQAVRAMETLKDGPFFLGVGFLKPHLPFIAPKRYFDLYPLDKIEMPDYAELPVGVPELALHNNGEIRYYGNIGNDPITPEKARHLVRAYYASISYIDAQVGLLLRALDNLGLRDNTTVCLWGDHGWHLNNHGLWQKHSNFEKATRAPLIFADPEQRAKGRLSKALVEFVDIYPTLAELTGIVPDKQLEGLSLRPLLNDPDRNWKSAAFSQYPRTVEGKPVMGYSLRTARYRYTEWQLVDNKQVVARELYDYEIDPHEIVNYARNPENGELVAALSQQLKAGWTAALPRA